MKKSIFTLFILGFFAFSAPAEWSGYVKQGYQKRAQFFNPTVVQSWLSDTVSSATRLSNEQGPVTEIEALWDIEIPRATVTAGLFGRVLWYSGATYQYLFYPWLKYHNAFHSVRIGRDTTSTWGSGLLLANYPALGITYNNQRSGLETSAFYYAAFEPSVFQKADIRYGGISGILNFTRGRLGLLFSYDDSPVFADAARSELGSGLALSVQGNWEWSNEWYAQAEVVYAGAWALFGGLDIPLWSFLPLQARVRFMAEGYNPLLGQYSREGDKQTLFSLRFPMNFLSEQFIIRPSWGLKHTPDGNYWVPGIKIESTISNTLWLQGQLYAEQPQDEWGAFKHYEYTELNLIWMITEGLFLDVRWTKTFNGFLEWKETQSLAGLEFQW
ncbi:hypothetical protein KAR34_03480 [bacterium]|nr:hypothetical protein [bacterium]